MNKKQLLVIIVLAALVTLVMQLFVTRFIAAKLSTVASLNRFAIFNPQGPLVINTLREVRVSDSGDIQDTVTGAKSKLATIFLQEGPQLKPVGSALNITTDGYFLTTSKVFTSQSKQAVFWIKLSSGETAQITQQSVDPATGLVICRAALTNVPVVNFGDSSKLSPGQKIVFISAGTIDFNPRAIASFVSFSQKDFFGAVFSADKPTRSFGVQPVAGLELGQAIFNTDGEVIGVWDGTNTISADVVRTLISIFLESKEHIDRPFFGFTYKTITPVEAKLLQTSLGARVTKNGDQAAVVLGSPAEKAGLVEGDIIRTVNNDSVSADLSLEQILEAKKPGDTIRLGVERKTGTVTLELTVSSFK